jgi:hypothetical protein
MSLKTVLKPMQNQSGVIKLTPFVTDVVSASIKNTKQIKLNIKKIVILLNIYYIIDVKRF